ncbi:MAG: 30S ribosomal protein S12 methylthiotransferase RimO [Clostridia bacterium]|nr:30S ribosomal protein S12 methylthiotransferase RimO [Clostridia bacterium]
MVKDKKVGVISLGCDKNRVDTEKMLYLISEKHSIVSDILTAEIVIINTCAFLESSRKEAIDEILSVAELKREGNLEKLVITGCLPQKFVGELIDALPEVDAFTGVSDYAEICSVIDRIYSGERVVCVKEPKDECLKSRVRTTDHYAYLKIADGCDNHCTYCLIPSIRGKFRSAPKAELIDEVKSLGKVKELILVAQDLTKYGSDLEGVDLVDLINEISALDGVEKIRLLYCYPEGINERLIECVKNNPKVVKYLDIPLQHADDKVLKRMNRKGTGESYLNLINRLKQEIPSIALRSTFITGFPGESEQAFNNLVEFIKSAQLFNAGFFAYSREEGTPAYKLDGQIDNKTKTARLKKLYSTQKKVVKKILSGKVGEVVEVLAEGFDQDSFVYYGRAYFNAPEVDGKIYFFSADEIEYGKLYSVRIDSVTDYDLYGERL